MQKKNHWYIYRHKRRSILAIIALIFLSMFLFQNASFSLRTLTSVAFLGIFYFVDHFFDLKFKLYHYIFVLVMIIAGLLLSPLYFIYPQFDKIQHFILPILVSALVFHMISQQKLDMRWKIIFTVLSAIAIITIHELVEYTLDILFDLKLQGVYLRNLEGLEKLNLIQNQIDDTMIDLILGFTGAISYGLFKWKQLTKNLTS